MCSARLDKFREFTYYIHWFPRSGMKLCSSPQILTDLRGLGLVGIQTWFWRPVSSPQIETTKLAVESDCGSQLQPGDVSGVYPSTSCCGTRSWWSISTASISSTLSTSWILALDGQLQVHYPPIRCHTLTGPWDGTALYVKGQSCFVLIYCFNMWLLLLYKYN